MKRLLFQFDTDAHPSVFDTVIAYDSGADHVITHSNVSPDNVKMLVEGTIFTRAPKDKKNTAIFVGGSNMVDGEKVYAAVQRTFFQDFRVSVMLDSNGSNTTAAAAVAKLQSSSTLKNKRIVILAGTGPVGQRTAVMLTKEGAKVTITSRSTTHVQEVCQKIKDTFDVEVTPLEAKSHDERAKAIENAQVVVATGATGIELLSPEHWQDNPNIEMIADANATPPLGVGGTKMMDKGENRNGKIIWGAIGFGTFKLALHRHCIDRLFQDNQTCLDAEEILNLAKGMT